MRIIRCSPALVVAAAILLLAPAGSQAAQPDALLAPAQSAIEATESPGQQVHMLLDLATGFADCDRPTKARQAIHQTVQLLREQKPGQALAEAVARRALQMGFTDAAARALETLPGADDYVAAAISVADGSMEARPQQVAVLIGNAARRLADEPIPGRAPELVRVMLRLGLRDKALELVNSLANSILAAPPTASSKPLLADLAVANAILARQEAATQMTQELEHGADRATVLAKLSALNEPPTSHHLLESAQAELQRLDGQSRLSIMIRVAEWCDKHDLSEPGRRWASMAEQALATAGTDSHMWRTVIAIYGRLDAYEDAARLARQRDDEFSTAKYRALHAIQLAKSGRTAEAVNVLKTLDAETVHYAGIANLLALAPVYLAARPDTDLAPAGLLENDYFREAVRRRLIERELADSDYAPALELADELPPRPPREEALQRVGETALHDTGWGSVEARMDFALSVADRTLGVPEKMHLLYRVARMAQRHGDQERLQEAMQELSREAERNRYEGGRFLAHGYAALITHDQCEPLRAKELVRSAVQTQSSITCGSCLDYCTDVIFGELFRLGDMDMIRTALSTLAVPSLQLRESLRGLRTMDVVAREDRQFLLQLALRAALQHEDRTRMVQTLVQVAAAYHAADLSPANQEMALLQETPAWVLAEERRRERAQKRRQTTSRRVALTYFYSHGCDDCERAEQVLSEALRKEPAVTLRKYDINTQDGTILNKGLSAKLQLPKHRHLRAPSLFAAGGALVDEAITLQAVGQLVGESRGLPDPAQLTAQERQSAQDSLEQDANHLGVAVLVSGALVDGLNPCAFTVIIFLVTYLAYVGKSGRQILWVGGVFMAAVFATYFAAGLGLAHVLRVTGEISPLISKFIYAVTAALVLVAAVLSARDAVLCLKGKTRNLALSLPDGLKKKIRLTISHRTRAGLTFGTTAVVGVLVALFELPCTGQMYVPLIIYAINNLGWHAAGWLLLYNVVFILPLAAVLLLTFFGLTSESLTAFFRRHVVLTKIGLTLVFAGLFVLMLLQLL